MTKLAEYMWKFKLKEQISLDLNLVLMLFLQIKYFSYFESLYNTRESNKGEMTVRKYSFHLRTVPTSTYGNCMYWQNMGNLP